MNQTLQPDYSSKTNKIDISDEKIKVRLYSRGKIPKV